MRRIRAEEAAVGDVLAEPLVSEQGRALLPKGARLSAAVISRLRGWGIRTLTVEGEDSGSADAQRLLADLEERFSGHEDDELMMAVREIARGHLSRK